MARLRRPFLYDRFNFLRIDRIRLPVDENTRLRKPEKPQTLESK